MNTKNKYVVTFRKCDSKITQANLVLAEDAETAEEWFSYKFPKEKILGIRIDTEDMQKRGMPLFTAEEKKQYHAIYKFTAYFSTDVQTASKEEAETLAEEIYTDADFGEATSIDGELDRITENEEGAFHAVFKFEANFSTDVWAFNESHARKLAEEIYIDADFGEASDIDGELVELKIKEDNWYPVVISAFFEGNAGIKTYTFVLEINDFNTDVEDAVKKASTDYCQTKNGRETYEGNCKCFNWGDFFTHVPDDICARYGIRKRTPDWWKELAVSFNETLVDENEIKKGK